MKRKILFSLLSLIFLTTACGDEAEEAINNDDPIDGCFFQEIFPQFQACLSPNSEDNLDVITWNIELFPISGQSTIDAVESIVINSDADVIALQEITSLDAIQEVAESLNDWDVQMSDVSGSLELGFLYKTCEIASISSNEILDITEPRPVVATTITHNNGLEVTIMTTHLKCCDGADNFNRRLTASQNMKTYIDENLPSSNVILLGDLNDELGPDSPFTNFSDDSENYAFADQSIADGPSEFWSYPSFGPEGSHIDHIIITNELFDNLINVETLLLSNCVSGYSSSVSDHRPVMASFRAEQ